MQLNRVLRAVARVLPELALLSLLTLPLLSSSVTSLSILTAEAASAPSFVQAADAKATSGSTVSANFPGASAAGNTIVVYVLWSNTGSVSVADSSGNIYHA